MQIKTSDKHILVKKNMLNWLSKV